MSLIYLLGFFVFFVYYMYLISKEKYTYWTKKNIVQCEPWYLFGNFGALFLQRISISDLMNNMYKQFPSARYFGIYQFLRPNLVIRDIDLIKRITVKDFETFPEHRSVIPDEADPLFARNILFMRGGEKWQRLRSLLSPAFTSSKLKCMYPFIVKCAKQFVEHYENTEGVLELEIKDAFSKFTNDVIATTTFGMECNSFKNTDDMFYTMGKRSISLSFISILKTFMFMISPFIMKFCQFSILPTDVSNFFRNVVINTLKFREENGIVRPDMLHLLNEARKGRMQYDEEDIKSDSSFAIVQESEIGKKQKFKYSDITDDDLIAQAVVFYLAGFDTSSTALSFCSYELAINPDVQEKLRNEIDQFLLSSKENFITYEELLSMKYLDLVVTESLRTWPPLVFIDRHAVKPFTIKAEYPEEKTVHLPKGTICLIPVHAIHKDPKYYANPEKFDPERFADENKHLLMPGSYLPFGMGPKNCIGSRFALLEIKIILFAILSKFEIVPVSKTLIPMVTRKKGIFLGAEGGFWLGLKKRNL